MRHPRPLTVKQAAMLDAIGDGEARGRPYTVRELCDLFGIASTNGVQQHLRWLERKGVLAPRDPGDRRVLAVRRPYIRHASGRVEVVEAVAWRES